MDSEFKIKKKYVKFSLAANIIFNNSIFAGCNKKGNKGYSGKGDKSTETNTTPNKETPKKPEKPNKNYEEKKTKLLEQLNSIDEKINLLTENKIDFNKSEWETKINGIDSDEKVNNIEDELNSLKSEIEEAKKKEEEAKKKKEEEKKDEEKKEEEKKEEDEKNYEGKKTELLEQLNIIEKNNNLLTENKIGFNKSEWETKINGIDSDDKVNDIENELNDLKSKIEEAKKKEEEKKAEEEERKKLIENFKTGYKIEGSDNLTLKLDNNKFKLYYNSTFIAESETNFDEKDIKKADDYTKCTYTIILGFAGRCKRYIKNLKIDDIIKHIKNCKEELDTCCKGLDNCFIKINIYFNEEKYDDSYYDINTGQLFYTRDCYFDSSLKNITQCIVPIDAINKTTYKFTLNSTGRGAYYNGKYCTLVEKDGTLVEKDGTLVKKDPRLYFKTDNTITGINDGILKEEIEKFSKISLKNIEK